MSVPPFPAVFETVRMIRKALIKPDSHASFLFLLHSEGFYSCHGLRYKEKAWLYSTFFSFLIMPCRSADMVVIWYLMTWILELTINSHVKSRLSFPSEVFSFTEFQHTPFRAWLYSSLFSFIVSTTVVEQQPLVHFSMTMIFFFLDNNHSPADDALLSARRHAKIVIVRHDNVLLNAPQHDWKAILLARPFRPML